MKTLAAALLLALAGLLAAQQYGLPCATSGRTYVSCPVPWKFAGPFSYQNNGEGIASMSAVETVVAKDGVVTIGFVNGGVWRTNDVHANNNNPSWTVLTDKENVRCVAISALAVSGSTIVAGCGGSTSSEMGQDWNEVNSADWGGLMYSTDDGGNWTQTDSFVNQFVSDVVIVPASASPTKQVRLLVGVRSQFQRKDEGGIYVSDDMGKTWTQTFSLPVFSIAHSDFADAKGPVFYASVPIDASSHIVRSTDFGTTWQEYSTGISYDGGRVPFYPKLAVGPTFTTNTTSYHVALYIALTVSPANSSDTFSDAFYLDSSDPSATWVRIANIPDPLDQDRMPKDRGGVLHDPDMDGLAYVAGNAGSVIYRVTYRESKWERMWGLRGDTSDNSAPHVDCRNLAWENQNDELLLVSDGGIFLRTLPRTKGGLWQSLAGDASAIEIYNADWEARTNRFVGAAQDNSVIISQPDTPAGAVGIGVVGGDGTMVSVDNTHCPSRMFGCAQFLGGWRYYADTGDGSLVASHVPFSSYFKDLQAAPFFLTWYKVNRLRPDSLLFAVNDTSYGVSGLWQFYPVPDVASLSAASLAADNDGKTVHPHRHTLTRISDDLGTTDLAEMERILSALPHPTDQDKSDLKLVRQTLLPNADWPAPTLVQATPPGTVLFVHQAGSHYLHGHTLTPDPDRVVGMNNTHFFSRTGAFPLWSISELPQEFVAPVDWTNYYNKNKSVGIGPISHGKTVSLALSLRTSDLVAVTGWPQDPSFNMNVGSEAVWVTFDSGRTWRNITGDLLLATATVAMARPAGLEFVDDIDGDGGTVALLAGTVTGVYVTFIHPTGPAPVSPKWTKLGDCTGIPLTVVPSVLYEPYSDTLVAGTFGRGVFALANAKQHLRERMLQQTQGTCNVGTVPTPPDNAFLLPPQLSC